MPNSEELGNAYGPTVRFRVGENEVVYSHLDASTHEPLMLTPYEAVKEFHRAYNAPVADKPQFLSEERFALRRRLISEEYEEFLDAVETGDLVNAFKELADLMYVVAGTAVEMGGNLDDVFEAVHESNMSKLDENGNPIYREDGKVLKGKNYQPPDIKGALGLD